MSHRISDESSVVPVVLEIVVSCSFVVESGCCCSVSSDADLFPVVSGPPPASLPVSNLVGESLVVESGST